MINMSINQLLALWGELARAYYHDNSFGGDTARIYSHLFKPYVALFAEGHINRTSAHWEEYAEFCKTAYDSFIVLLKKFETDFGCVIELDERKLKKLPKNNEFHTHYHVKVIRL